jgi:tRNA(His) guanylyltransferase
MIIKTKTREEFIDTDSSDQLGDRMKFFEDSSRYSLKLEIGEALCLRFDGRSFSSFTKGYDKPFDEAILNSMIAATEAACQEIQGAFFAFTQSDEITVLCRPINNYEEEVIFKGNIQKICSTFASTVATVFNLEMSRNRLLDVSNPKYYRGGLPKLAAFDCRVWAVPEIELQNVVLWRQLDCERNSISSCAHAEFSPKQLHGVNTGGMRDMLVAINKPWEEKLQHLKYGTCLYKKQVEKYGPKGEKAIRNVWFKDFEMPRLIDNKQYFNDILKQFIDVKNLR